MQIRENRSCGCMSNNDNYMEMSSCNCPCQNENTVDCELRREMIQEIRCLDFAITELALYLDTHPEDEKALCLHRKYAKQARDLKDKYQNGIVVISGTGVAIYGKYESQTTLIGGWGHIIRELGSAYACVHDLALNIIDQEENDLPLTLFQENFLTYLNKHHITDLKHLFYNHSKKEYNYLNNSIYHEQV